MGMVGMVGIITLAVRKMAGGGLTKIENLGETSPPSPPSPPEAHGASPAWQCGNDTKGLSREGDVGSIESENTA